MNKPVYLGQVILDLSKIVMYEFHYDYMIPKYGDRSNGFPSLSHLNLGFLCRHRG